MRKNLLATTFIICSLGLMCLVGCKQKTTVTNLSEEKGEEDLIPETENDMMAENFPQKEQLLETNDLTSTTKNETNTPKAENPKDSITPIKTDNEQKKDQSNVPAEYDEKMDTAENVTVPVNGDNAPVENEIPSEKEEDVAEEDILNDENKDNWEESEPKEINPTMDEYYIEEYHLKTGSHEARVELSNGNTCCWIGEKHYVLTSDQCAVLEEKLEENRVEMNQLKYVAKNPHTPGVFLVVTDTYPIEVTEEEFYDNPEYNDYLVFESDVEARDYKAARGKEVYENTILSFFE